MINHKNISLVTRCLRRYTLATTRMYLFETNFCLYQKTERAFLLPRLLTCKNANFSVSASEKKTFLV